MREKKPKILIIYGPTAIGKTALGLRLAKKFNGEIVSADSRQVYQGMDIGTGKEIWGGEWDVGSGTWIIDGVKIWLLDIVKPDEEFSVAQYVFLASKVIEDLWQRGKLPIIVGGTGFYIKALVDGVGTLGVEPDWELRDRLENLKTEELKNMLQKIDLERYVSMNESDINNPRRLIRAIEVASSDKKQVSQNSLKLKDILFIGLTTLLETLYQRIDWRVEERVRMGAEEEVRDLINQGYSWDLPAISGMGYRQWKPYFGGRENKETVIQRWKYDEHHYARRQLTWFRKDKRVNWFDISTGKWENEVEKLVSVWLVKKNAKKS
ncbi:MAG: tRNA (adenosine(37)-N6)-dimethylallyltransferase MiaA [bacterium]|nr:tRNA (adenosine(37)-N6)-dimethylallyltransferase MiaA [bacterium]